MGAAYVFHLDKSGSSSLGPWEYVQSLTQPNTEFMGVSVAIEGDWLAVGAPSQIGGKSSVFMYKRSGGVFVHAQTLTHPSTPAIDSFGQAVDMYIDAETSTLAVGCPDDKEDSGAVYVYTLSSGEWITKNTLTATKTGLWGYGYSLTVEKDTIVVGTETGGVVEVHSTDGDRWVWQNTLQVECEGTLSLSLHLDSDRDTLAVGCQDLSAGKTRYAGGVTTFYRNGAGVFGSGTLITGSKSYSFFGAGVVVTGSSLYVGIPGDNNFGGSVYTFQHNNPYNEDTWQIMDAEMCKEEDSSMGETLAIDNGILLAGMPQWDMEDGMVGILPTWEY
ncbi:hypothetical protein KIPB_004999 [Kipferlia bialata]|uniref:Uncharacterized protein n=1 Tax=Kipferlia bialata TaxID=797122 RepID=A0A9K3CWD1_9EUKA|nr:hypothetical protein KIPB_004999 [Kipferlia bialata]|eukprot:g4999.t1